MKKLYLVTAIITGILYLDGLLPVAAQQSEFTRVFYDPLPDRSAQVYGAIKTPDGNYLLGGYKDHRPSVIKMDPLGNIIWGRNYSDTTGNIYCLTPTNDAHFILAGNITNYNSTQSELLFIKINQEGDTVWSKLINMGQAASAFFIRQTSDKGFISGGFFEDSSPPDPKSFILKLDSLGNLSWCKGFSSGKYNNTAFAAAELPGGNYILTGSVGNGTGYSSSLLLMKISSLGEIVWSKKQSNSGNYLSTGNDLKVLPDGILCYFTDFTSAMALMKTDTSGNILWSKDVGHEGSYVYSRPGGKMCETAGGGYLLMNSAEMFGPMASLVKVDSNAEPIWAKTAWIIPSIALQTYDGGIIVAGNGPIIGVRMSVTYNPQIGIIKMNASGNSSYCVESNSYLNTPAQATMVTVDLATTIAGIESNFHPSSYNITLDYDTGCIAFKGGMEETALTNPLKIIPNPSSGDLRFEFNTQPRIEINSLIVYNSLGEVILSKYGIKKEEPGINLSFLSNGVYEIMVVAGGRVYSQKVLIIHQ
ncbi:MAG: T9SS type A sorting domain-containing protein [Bacteroidetes bacterium]|nr:T9SS type A sorting domain-containing protein [Bacteroidota bacterium]